jgi:FkbM family methyltransferase
MNIYDKIIERIRMMCFVGVHGAKIRFSFSLNDEDRFLKLYFRGKKGFYVDIGANHPILFSNTYLLYREGWSGINIDVKPGSMDKFNKLRKRDINIEAGISNSDCELDYYSFKTTQLNTFDKEVAENRIAEGSKLIEVKKIKTEKLSSILDRYCEESSIQFMSVDVEGLELDVLRSNDWDKYRPELLVVECLDNTKNIEDIESSELFKFMKEKNYVLYARLYNTCIFKDWRQPNNKLTSDRKIYE